MATIKDVLADALAHHRSGRLAQAAAGYEAVLGTVPDHPDALHLLGVAYLQAGHPREAEARIRAAIRADQGVDGQGVADYHDNLGSALRALGRAEEAVAAHREAIRLRPGFAQAFYNLGNALEALGRLGEAADAYAQAAALRPDYARARFNLGNALAALGRAGEAADAYRAALRDDPGFVEAWANLGALMLQRGEAAGAAGVLRRALALRPDHATALANLSAAFLASGPAEAAEPAARRAMVVRPDFAEAALRHGDALQRRHRLAEAGRTYERAVALRPDLAEAWANLALVRQTQGLLDPAEAGYRRALALRPDLAEVRSNLAYLELFRPGVTLARVLEAHRAWDAVHGAPLRAAWTPHPPDNEDRPLVVGILSGDFRRHPAGQFAIRAVEALPAQGVRLFLYANQTEEDDLTARFRAAAERWLPVSGLTDAELAARIRADGVDALIDLAGHNARGRLGVFARKPAPVQVAWSGYMATTGLAAMDALVADDHHVPEGAERFYTERILRMPGAFIAYDPPADAPEPAPPPCLEGRPVTFGAFNILTKLTDAVLATWAAVLDRVPDSRLLLKTKALSCPETAALWRGRLAAAGIASDRLTLVGATNSLEHMAWCAQVDVALDPFPFAGSTTTLETLWMGVPVITLPGETFSSRHSLAFLAAAGVEGCVARDPDHYVEIAAGWAADPARLAALRARLRGQMAASSLCDGGRLAARLAQSLRDLRHGRP
ncbi:tetratricopeptide repeat protein [Azospirillum rugosum]|uniref:protein O-GlcNAc transferase n=1 Tax=Azospirillum rugosum TaxID=416170 RepID=A0ABS4SGF7_9PROT|nr:glycosyltransferase family 41 protein [Azospirillum rugosum]MBP2291647.1 putative O-linked N-acetylglucosamine transferase (SPINDLY family) [Azospirillum rugosum]MDQ0524541.1 putative O-linked N-acetylglucosamine transferase (SPINDLY family) [Azospirillum rugosum]